MHSLRNWEHIWRKLIKDSRQAHLLKTTSSSEQGLLGPGKAGPPDGKPDTERSPNLIQRFF